MEKLLALLHPIDKRACRETYKVWFGEYLPEKLSPIMEKPEMTYWAWLPDFFPYPPLPRWVRSILGG